MKSKADPELAHWASAPLLENFKGCIFENYESITRTNFIESTCNVYNMCFIHLTLTTKA